jgi:hypothetical protein
MDQHLTRPEEEQEEEQDVTEDKTTFFGCTQGTGSSQKVHMPSLIPSTILLYYATKLKMNYTD